MATTLNSTGGKAVLTLAHVVGMIDMVALPLWIGALMQYYKYSPAQAGITVTVFLLGVVVSSVLLAPGFNLFPRRAVAAVGFGLGALAFYVISLQPVAPASFTVLAVLHALGGLGVGGALTFTHGSIGRSANPHRLFAVVNVVLGVFAVFFLGGMPKLIGHMGAQVLFTVVACTMALAALVMALAFPNFGPEVSPSTQGPVMVNRRIPRAAWFAIGVVMCLTLNQAMVFSFVERIGMARGFGVDAVHMVLIALGLVNLTPGVLAALLQKKWSPIAVGMGGPVAQAALAVTMSSAVAFASYAVAASLYVFMVIFTHTFIFGLLSRLDPSGRTVAGTPAMMMVGSCIGPALGGGIVQTFGYSGLGWAACGVAFVAVVLMLQVRRRLTTDPVLQPAMA